MAAKYTIRLLRESDRAKLVAISQSRDAKLGTSYWIPPLTDERTDVVFVCEKDGEVIGAFVLRRVWETVLIGDSPDVMRAVLEGQEKMRLVAQDKGIDELVGFVPEQFLVGTRKRGMEKLLKRGGFSRVPGVIAFEGSAKIKQ